MTNKEAIDYIRSERNGYSKAQDKWVFAESVLSMVEVYIPFTVEEVESLLKNA